MNSAVNYDKTVKEWTIMLTYISGTYKGSIKALAQANGLDYSRCIRMNKSLKKKANKVEYVNSLIKKYTNLRDSVVVEPVVAEPVVVEPVVVAEPVVAEPVVAEPVVAELTPIVSSPLNLITEPSFELDMLEYITKNDFNTYRETINATFDSIIESQKYSDIVTSILVFTVSIIGVVLFVSLTQKSSFRT